ncbi:MAG: glycine betaine ABC transporter substrate-binding protein [Desulfobacteraceae bacterium]|nr:glycine betaine ABC transporter substrate-binding protein [Desulfobacteraceae bacterium]
MLKQFFSYTLIVAFLLCHPVSALAGKIKLIYGNWDSAIASASVVKFLLEDELGYEVGLIKTATVSDMWQSVASGKADFMLCAWLPTSQNSYLEKNKHKVVDLGPNLRGARVGLIVPSYVTINSVEEVSKKEDKFSQEIVGISKDTGLMKHTQKLVDHYQLDMNIVYGSEGSMLAVLKNRIKRKEWVMITGWTPHWMFQTWDLKYLKAPRNFYGGEEFVNTIIRKGLESDVPGLMRFLKKFHWKIDDVTRIISWMHKGMEPGAAAKRWIKENQVKVGRWLR